MPNVVWSGQPAAEATDRFDELFGRLYPRLFGLAYRLLGERTETEDLLQEAFLKLAHSPVLDRPDEEVAAWLGRVCLNLGSNHVRDRRRARERLERVGRLELAAAAGDRGPASAVLRHEARTEVHRALACLPERQRDCLLLRHSGYAYAEIAATLGIALGRQATVLAVQGEMVTLGVTDPEVAPRIAEWVVRSGYRLYGLAPTQRSLEDIFVSLVDGREP